MIEINWNPSQKELRFFALGVAILVSIAGVFSLRTDPPQYVLLCLVATLAAAMILLGSVKPLWVRPIYLGWMIAVFPIGWIISHLVLAVVYFCIFLPIGAALRMTGYDPLQKSQKPPGDTYWVERKTSPSKQQYFRQY
jgi:hypothetical protein